MTDDPVTHDAPDYDDATLRRILREVKTIAMVGVSPNPIRPSYFVGRYLSLRGYRVLPVNPVAAGETLFGEEVAPDLETLAARGETVDMVDIFRRSEEAGAIADEAVARFGKRGLKVIWMQIGVTNPEAARRAEAAGIEVIMNRCPKIERQRLCGELSIGGFNSRVISAKLR